MITAQQMLDLEAKAKAAQKGPFVLQRRYDNTLFCGGSVKLYYGTDVNHVNGMHVAFFHANSTAEYFQVASPSVIIELIEQIRNLEKELAKVREELSDITKCHISSKRLLKLEVIEAAQNGANDD